MESKTLKYLLETSNHLFYLENCGYINNKKVRYYYMKIFVDTVNKTFTKIIFDKNGDYKIYSPVDYRQYERMSNNGKSYISNDLYYILFGHLTNYCYTKFKSVKHRDDIDEIIFNIIPEYRQKNRNKILKQLLKDEK